MTQPDNTIDSEVEELLGQYKQRVLFEGRKHDIAYVDKNTREQCERNLKLYTSEAAHTITNLIAQEANKARIDELQSHIERETGTAGTIHMEKHEVDNRIAQLEGNDA